MKRPAIEDIHTHSKIMYYMIFAMCLLILGLFSYTSYFIYKLTYGTRYAIITSVIVLPIIVAFILMALLVYTGKRKFYRFVEKGEY